MEVTFFDTLAYANRLKGAGMDEKQAEVLAESQAELIESNLATKRDLKELELALKHDIKELEITFKHDIKELEITLKHDIVTAKAEIFKWCVGLLFLQAGFIITAIKLIK